MARTFTDIAISARAKELVKVKFSDRGRFGLLEAKSGLSIGQWKNFFYGRQLLNKNMLSFLISQYPHEESWLLTGERPVGDDDSPFSIPAPSYAASQTLSGRFGWAIREFAPTHGSHLFDHLQIASGLDGAAAEIPADEWASVLLDGAEPSLQMMIFICSQRPQFAEWVLTGAVGATPQFFPGQH